MSVKQTFSIVFLGIFVLLIFNTFFSVHETRQAIVLQFGRPVGAPITEPGLKTVSYTHLTLPTKA